MKKNILIAGLGNLGSRYLQGLASCPTPLNIYLKEPSVPAKKMAIERWHEVVIDKSDHTINLEHLLDGWHKDIDLAIISTNSDVRANVIEEISVEFNVKVWIIEKNIAQSKYDLQKIVNSTKGAKNIYVNLPRCVMPWYKNIKSNIKPKEKIEIKVTGGRWGLACNSIHLLHLCSFFTGERIIDSKFNEKASCTWYETKRVGFYDFLGEIDAEFSEGSRVILVSSDGDDELKISLRQNDKIIDIYEEKGIAVTSTGEVLEGSLQYQSQITAPLVDLLVSGGGCELPSLADVLDLQSNLLNLYLKQWNMSYNDNRVTVPIT